MFETSLRPIVGNQEYLKFKDGSKHLFTLNCGSDRNKLKTDILQSVLQESEELRNVIALHAKNYSDKVIPYDKVRVFTRSIPMKQGPSVVR